MTLPTLHALGQRDPCSLQPACTGARDAAVHVHGHSSVELACGRFALPLWQ